MITVLNITKDKRTGIFARAAGAVKKGSVTVRTKSCGGVTVQLINCERSHGRVDWAKIAGYAAGSRGYVLCERGLLLPKKLNLKRFYSRSLYRLMAINGAISVLSLLKSECRRISLCFCDLSGEYSRYAPLFLPLCGDMTILTKSERYRAFPEYAMGEYGACVRMCKDVRQLARCSVIVSPRFIPLENYRGGQCVAFTVGGISENPMIETIDGYGWGVPPKYRALKPRFLSSEYFSQALYSIEHCTDASRISPYAFYMNGQELTASGVASEILSTVNRALDTEDSKVYNKL